MIPKRVFWLGVGYTAGMGTSYWAARKVKRAVSRYAPAEVTQRVQASVVGFGGTVRDAVSEGRAAMRAREDELRASLEPGVRPLPVEATPIPAEPVAALPAETRAAHARRARRRAVRPGYDDRPTPPSR